MTRRLLTEPFPFVVERESLNESKRANSGKILLTGLIQMAETPNGNGRIYPKNVLEGQVNAYQEVIAARRSLGELDHPSSKDTRDDPLAMALDRVSHMLTEVRMEGNAVYGTLQVLSTPAGKILEALINDGVMLGISSRGLGSLRTSGQYSYVEPDIEISGWDIVWMPSTTKAFLSEVKINESSKFRAVTTPGVHSQYIEPAASIPAPQDPFVNKADKEWLDMVSYLKSS